MRDDRPCERIGDAHLRVVEDVPSIRVILKNRLLLVPTEYT
jgi:hypothetical protein